MPCPDVFVQDAATFLLRKGMTVTDLFDPAREAVLDAAHQVRLNYEAFLFADLEGKERFEADPLRYCGLLTDPVTKERFRPTERALTSEHEGVRFYFSSTESLAAFRAGPAAHALPGWVM